MNNNEKKLISEFAENIRFALVSDKKNYNFDIEDLVKTLGGSIKSDDYVLGDASIIKKSDKSFLITLDKFTYSEKRKRFTLAHELGHLFLHMKYLLDEQRWNELSEGDGYNRNGVKPYSRLEYEANIFAASFLMPEKMFIEIAESTSDDNEYHPELIARKFNVSMDSVIIRGKTIGIWE